MRKLNVVQDTQLWIMIQILYFWKSAGNFIGCFRSFLLIQKHKHVNFVRNEAKGS